MRGASSTAGSAPAAPLPAAEEALDPFGTAVRLLLAGASLEDALAGIATSARLSTRAAVAIVRTAEPGRPVLVARAVEADSLALAAELAGSRVEAGGVPAEEVELAAPAEDARLPAGLRHAAGRVRADVALVVPVHDEGTPVATLELLRAGAALSEGDRRLARRAAAQIGLAARLARALGEPAAGAHRARLSLDLLGEALAAGADETEAAEHIVRLAAEGAGAEAAILWRVEPDSAPSLLAVSGCEPDPDTLAPAAEEAARAVAERRTIADGRFELVPDGTLATLAIGEPPLGALQLALGDRDGAEERLEALSVFGARAAIALRRTRQAQLASEALGHSRALIAVVSQAIARLSLAHTLETAVERIGELTGTGRVGIYLREGGRLNVAASLRLERLRPELVERLLELALGPFRGRGFVVVEDLRADPRVADLESVVVEAGLRRALLVPLVVRDEVIGALGVFQRRPRPYREGEEALLLALSTQLAVAVQNARLHVQTKELGAVLEGTLESERQAARQVRALYEISHAFTESLSLDATLDAVARTMCRLFELDVVAIRLTAERRELLELRASHVADPVLRDAAEAFLARLMPLDTPLERRLLQRREPIVLTPTNVRGSAAHEVLEPFLAKGASACVLPMATAGGEVLGELTLVSFDAARPVGREVAESAMAVTAAAALAIDNARLYQQQKAFTETMQRSLLPRALPEAPGLEVGHVYQSSAKVEVGGDVYDFLTLEDGRLAVVLGDVAGKGIEATADMAMAKFTFRALARSHPDPVDFLAEANEVVVEEIGLGKFITMIYVLVDPATREVACASAGHPPIRLIALDGTVTAMGETGLALGIDPDQRYPSERRTLEAGASVVLYTDGLIESRRDGELYGEARLDALLRAQGRLPAQELADAIVADCRAFAGGELADDCAVVVLRLAQ